MAAIVCMDLGHTDHTDAMSWQKHVVDLRKRGQIPDVLVLTEHAPVYTMGRASHEDHLLDQGYLEENNIPLVCVDRGGDITFHGPGQLMVYPILDLTQHRKDVGWFIRQVEMWIIDVLAFFGIHAGCCRGSTGVWVDQQRKIASMGLGFSRWVSYHGVALNVWTDLSYFQHIVPCGLADVVMTSLVQEVPSLGLGPVLMEQVKERVSTTFCQAWGYDRTMLVRPCWDEIKYAVGEEMLTLFA